MLAPTASALALLERCPGQSVIEHYGTTSDAAVDGVQEHAELVPALLSGRLPDTNRGRWLARQSLPRYARGEVAYAVDLHRMRARELVCEYPRDYRGARPSEVCGTVDLVAEAETAELKCGDLPVDGPRRNRQMQFAAVARWLAEGVVTSMRLIQAYSNGYGWQQEHEPSAGELARWARELGEIVARVERAREASDLRPFLRRGQHCGFCDARPVCPAIDEMDGRDGEADRYLGAQGRYQAAKGALDRARDMLGGREHVAEDGRVIAPTTTWRRRIDTEAALEAIPELAAYTTRSLSVAALREYAETQEHLGRYTSHRMKAVEEQLEHAGALTYEPVHGYEER